MSVLQGTSALGAHMQCNRDAPGRRSCAARAGCARIARQRLVQRLDECTRSRLTTLIAPTGYGKSALVDEWAGRQTTVSVALARFQASDDRWAALERVIGAVAGLDGTRTHLDAAPRPKELGTLVDALALAGPGVLVLDGLDSPKSGLQRTDLSYLLAHAPAHLHVVVTSRSRLSASIPAAMSKEVAALTRGDLAFSRGEAEQLMRASGAELTSPELDTVMATTRGWCAGVGLAALGARAADDTEAYLAGFGGSDRDAVALFRTEVLAGEAPAVRRFLTLTSPLPWMTASLCSAVTGEPTAGEMLKSLDERGLFLVRLPGSGTRFVYHPMFRDFLRRELRLTAPEAEGDVLHRAARWFTRHERPEAAARCLFEARAPHAVLQLADHWAPAMLRDGRAPVLLNWLRSVGAEATDADADVTVRAAVVTTALGKFDEASELLRGLETRDCSPGQQSTVQALRAARLFFDSSAERARTALEAILRQLVSSGHAAPPDVFGIAWARSLATMATISRARMLWQAGDLVGARELLSPLAHEPYAGLGEHLQAASTLALVDAWAGHLTEARRRAARVLAFARRHGLGGHPATVDARIAAAHVLRERGALQEASELLDEAYAGVLRAAQPNTYASYCLERGLWCLAMGRPAQGLAVLEECYETMIPEAGPRVVACLRAAEVQLLLAVGRTDQAEAVIDRFSEGPRTPQMRAAAVHAAVARGGALEAAIRLKTWKIHQPEPDERLRRALWAGIVDFETGRRRQAVEKMLAVAASAEHEGYVRLFVDCGPPAERLIRAALVVEPTPYLHDLARTARAQHEPAAPGGMTLSDRELEVIRYLPTPLSNRDIAARLYISRNTVKTHLQAIYTKLGVADRREAIEAAQHLGLA